MTSAKMQIVFLLGLLVVLTNAAPKTPKFPKGFSFCPKISAEFEKCAVKAAADSLPTFLMGLPKLGIPPLIPLILPLIRLENSRNLQLNMTDVTVLGLENTKVLFIKADLEKGKFKARIHIDELTLQGTYIIDGRILILPIVGKGPGQLKAFNGDYDFSFELALYEKNGVEYANMTKTDLKLNIKKAEFKLENLFNGDKRLGDEMNKFLNENWEKVLEDFGKIIGDTISSLVVQLAENLFGKIPYEDFFSH